MILKESIDLIIEDVHITFCPNIRSEFRYAVAEAYENRYGVDELEVIRIMNDISSFPVEDP